MYAFGGIIVANFTVVELPILQNKNEIDCYIDYFNYFFNIFFKPQFFYYKYIAAIKTENV